MPEESVTKVCGKCKWPKNRSEFYRCKRWQDGLDYNCKPCRKATNKASRQRRMADPERRRRVLAGQHRLDAKYRAARTPEERERHKAHGRAYYRANRDKFYVRVSARKAKLAGGGGSHSPEAWRQMVRLFGGRCLCCGRSGRMTKDHVLPVSAGGTDDIGNIQPLCLRCNKSKFTTDVDYRDRSKVVLGELNEVGRLLFEGGCKLPASLGKRQKSSRFVGVSYDRKNANSIKVWKAYICVGGRLKSLGRHATEQQAAAAYGAESRRLFGGAAFANLAG